MNFVEAQLVPERNGAGRLEVLDMLERFIAADINAAEVKDWQDTYKNIDGVYAACKAVVKELYPEKIKVVKAGDHVFIKRIDEVTE